MAFFEELTKKAKDAAAIAGEKARDAATAAKLSMAISSEQHELEKNYRAIGEWFVSEYSGEVPEALRDVMAAVAANKAKIAELEAQKAGKGAEPAAEAAEAAPEVRTCSVCGAQASGKFCPQCGAPLN